MAFVNWSLLSRGATVTARDYNPSYPPTRTIDFDGNTYWQSLPAVPGAWVEIDHQLSRTVTQIQWYQATGSTNRANLVRVEFRQTLLDPWSLALEVSHGGGLFIQDVGPYTGRYWRFTAITGGTGGWQVWTFACCGYEYVAPPEDPTMNDVTGLMDWLYDNPYQSVLTWMADRFPGWMMEPWEAFIMASVAYAVAQYPVILAAIEAVSAGEIDLSSVLTAISDHNTNVDTQLAGAALVRTTIANEATADRLAKRIDVTDALAVAQLALAENIDTEHVDTRAAVNAARDAILVNNNQQTSVLAVNDNANKDAILADAAAKAAALTATITSGLAQQTVDLAGPLATTHDELMSAIDGVDQKATDIQAILNGLSSNSGALPAWPGGANVDLLDEVVVTVPTELEVSCDGVIVSVTQYPPGQSRQPAGDVTRYKGLGWVAFRSDLDDHENLIAISMSHQVICPQVIAHPTGLAVYCKPGTRLVLTPFLISAV